MYFLYILLGWFCNSELTVKMLLRSDVIILSTPRLKIETEAWARSGLSTTVGSSYVLEPGSPVQTSLYDGKLYNLTLHRQGERSVRILQTPGDLTVPHSLTDLEVSEEGLIMRLLCKDTTATIEFLRCEHEESQAYFW